MKPFAAEHEAHKILARERPLPRDARRERVVVWKAFRVQEQAIDYARHILLEDGQRVVGGCGEDDVGPYCWFGVQVDDLEAWGHPRAIQLVDPVDPGGRQA